MSAASRALGPDAWDPALLADVSRQGMAALADLINAMETKVAWSRQLLHVWYVLLPKPSGEKLNQAKNDRFGCFLCWCAFWERVRRPGLTNWCQQRAGHWDAAVPRARPPFCPWPLAKFSDNVHLPALLCTSRARWSSCCEPLPCAVRCSHFDEAALGCGHGETR